MRRRSRLLGKIGVTVASIAILFVGSTATAAILFSDGFESGNFSTWTTVKTAADGTATVQNAIVKTGTYAARLSATSTSGSLAYARKTLAAAQSDITVGGDFQVLAEGAAGSNVPLIRLFDPAGSRLISVYRPNQSNQLWVQAGSSFFSTSGTLPLNTWGNVQVHATTNGAASALKIWLNNNVIYSSTSASLGTSGVQTLQIGNDVAAQTFTIVADNIFANTGPPTTTITSGPSGSVNSTSASFSFTSSEPGSTFQCSLDAASFSACSSPASYSNLADGAHAFQVRATDLAGNTDPTPPSRTWTVDTVAPAAPVISSPPDGSLLASSSLVLGGSAEPGSRVTVLEASSSVGQTAADGGGSWSATVSGVAEGAHTYTATATDAAGNVSPLSNGRTVTVDTTPPDTTITSGPSGSVNTTSGSFSFSSNDSGATFQCSLDAAAFSACISPVSYSNLADGAHTFQVRAIDLAGNIDPTPGTRSWTVDTTPPDTTITSSPPNPSGPGSATFAFSSTEQGSTFKCSLDAGLSTACTSPTTSAALSAGDHTFSVQAVDLAGNVDPTPATYTWTVVNAPETTITSGPSGLVNTSSASFSFSSDESGSTFECSLDAAAFSSCISPVNYTSVADGSHTFRVRAIDSAGNVDPTPASQSWTVDTTPPPAPVISNPADGSYIASSTLTFSGTAEAASTVSVFEASNVVATTTTASGGSWSATLLGVPDGVHTYTATATDAAGNVSVSSTARSVTVDTTPPDTTITSGPSGTVNSPSAIFSFSSNETGATFQCSLDAAAFNACSPPLSYSGLADGAHTFQVRAIDLAGNIDPTPASQSWTVDTGVLIAAAGDIACAPVDSHFNGGLGTANSCHEKATSDLLVAGNYAAVLPLGDDQYDCGGYDSFLQSYDPTWGRVKNITDPVPGNHEYQSSAAKETDCDSASHAAGYFKYYGSSAGDPTKGYYSYDRGFWHIIALNSNCGNIGGCGAGSPEETWLKADLAAHPKFCTLAYWHHPRFSSSVSDSMTSAFWQDLYNAGADLVLNGHMHNYERFVPMDPTGAADPATGIREFVVGTGGEDLSTGFGKILATSEVHSRAAFGVLQLTLRATSYDWKFLPEAGATFTDSGSTSCH